MYTIKEKPKDFLVDEIIDMAWYQEPQKYSIFLLKKTSLNTIQVIDMLCKHLHLKTNDIGFAGIKDRHAITTQYISIPVVAGKTEITKVLSFAHPNVTLSHVGYYHKHVGTPLLKGNTFTITVRNIAGYSITPIDHMINFFGEQRFSKNNADIGYAFVKKDFKKAVECILAYSSDESKLTYNEKKVLAYLADNPTDYVGALRQLPGQTCKFFLHAYQSKLWNQTVSHLLVNRGLSGTSCEDIFALLPSLVPIDLPPKVPAIGFFYDEDDWSAEVNAAISQLFLRDSITERDFVIKQMSEVTEPGAVRQTVVPIRDFAVLEKTDEFIRVTFTLPRGSYATVALRQIFRITA